jgi:hypothetical protein
MTPASTGGNVVIERDGREELLATRHPPHFYQLLIQTIVGDLLGQSPHESTGGSRTPALWGMDHLLGTYGRSQKPEGRVDGCQKPEGGCSAARTLLLTSGFLLRGL